MLTLEQISNQFPLSVRQINPRGMLVEYLQHELLEGVIHGCWLMAAIDSLSPKFEDRVLSVRLGIKML